MSGRGFRRVGITGGIGAGKSTVSDRLRKLGALVVDADMAARAVVAPNSQGLIQLVKHFGQDILAIDGTLVRSRLANRVFGNEKQRQAMDAILHPLIQAWMMKEERLLLEKYGGKLVFWDVPLLVETGMQAMMDSVWLVTARRDVRMARITARDGCTQAEARARMKSQLPEREKRKVAQQILDNSRDMVFLYQQVDALYAQEMQQAQPET